MLAELENEGAQSLGMEPSLHKVLDSFASIERNEKKIKAQDNFHAAPSMLVDFACVLSVVWTCQQ